MDPTNEKEFSATIRWAMKYIPKLKKMTVTNRVQYAILYIAEGDYLYTYDDKAFTAHAGDVVLSPQGGNYTYEITSESAVCYQIEFELEGFQSAVRTPTVIESSDDLPKLIKAVTEYYGKNDAQTHMLCLSAFYRICASIPLEDYKESAVKKRIRPAINYIETHYTEKTDPTHLAKLCCMSESTLRRCFNEELGVSPITYKNKFRINRSKDLILYSDLTISQIAYALGFGNVYEFSNMFKQYVGYSPSQFVKNTPDESGKQK